jgi:hypothetical protein
MSNVQAPMTKTTFAGVLAPHSVRIAGTRKLPAMHRAFYSTLPNIIE